MPSWRDLRRYLDRHGILLRENGNHYLYKYKGKIIPVSKGSGEIGYKLWHRIMKKELELTQEEFNMG